MARPEGKLSHIGIAGETYWGTAVAAADYLKFSSESLALSIEDLVSGSLNGYRDESESHEGLNTVAGDTVHDVHPTNLGYFLRSFFGHPATVAHGTSSYTHVFNPESGILASTRKGTAASGGATSLVTTQTWVASEHIGRWVHIVGGTGKGQSRYITANDATTLTVAAWVTNPDNTSVYEINLGPKDCIVPPYTLEVHRALSGGTPAFQYNGCVVNQLGFAVGTGSKIMQLTNSWIGKGITNIASTTPSLPSTTPFTWDQMKFGFNRATTATVDSGATTTSIPCSGTPGWTVNAYVGDIVFIKTGTGINQARIITANTASALTVGTLVTAPAAADTIEIFSAFDYTENLGLTLGNGLAGIPVLNNTNTIGKIEGDAARTGALSGTFEDQDITNFARFTGRTAVRACLYFEGATITGAHKHRIFIDMPYVLLTAYPMNVGGGGRMSVGITAKLKYDSTDARSYRIIVDNNKANYNL